IDNGEDWMQALLDFRNELSSHHAPDVKKKIREHKRRNGRVARKEDGTLIPGPYTLEVRKSLLRKLLAAQEKVRHEGPDPNATLISDEELQAIRRIWQSEKHDWEDSVPAIYREVTGDELECVAQDVTNFTQRDQELLQKIAHKHGVQAELVGRLLELERDMHGMSRRAGIYGKIDAIVREDWLSEDEIQQLYETEDGKVSV
ncbi:MAG: hypothetical protein KDA52_13775, partial [Planctomycetaceae bacterium]|nr:hypothetical protein [Planctomycetaceae bacterium]